jgi:outer membrane protein TolC
MVVVCNKATRALIFISTLLAQALCAQQKQNYRLSDFLDSAKRHLPQILQKKAILNASKAGITDTRHAYLPNVYVADQLNMGTDNAVPGSYLSYGIIPSSSNGIHTSNDYQSAVGNIAIFQSEYELLDFGLKKAKINNALAYADLSQADLEKETYLVEWEVGKLYFNLIKSQFQFAIDGENVTRYESIYKVIQAIALSGIKPGADSSLAMAELSKSRIVYNQTEGDIRQLLQEMSYYTGIPISHFAIDTTLSQNYLSTLKNLTDGSSIIESNNPLLDYYVKQVYVFRQSEDLIKKSYLPKVFLTATAWARGSSIDANGNYNALSEGMGYQRFNYLVGATFMYDLFDIVHRKDKLAVSQFRTEASDLDMQQQKLTLDNVRSHAQESIRTAVKNLTEIPIQIRASQDTYNQKIAQYKAGIINLIDLTNASFVLYRAQSDYVQTLSDWLLANLDRAASTGILNSFIQSIEKQTK